MPIVSHPLVVRLFITRGPNGWSERWPLATQDWFLGLAWAAQLAEARRHLLCADSWIEWAALAMLEPPYWEQCVITDPLHPLPQWGVNQSDMQGLLWTFETGTGGWSNHLFRAIDGTEIMDKRWIRRGLDIPDAPPPLPADLTTAMKNTLFQNTLATFRQLTATCQPLPPLPDHTPQYLMEPFTTVAFNMASSRMVGGAYKRVSWESLARSAAPAFTPCGMAVSVLRRCYQWRCRFYAGYPVEGIRYYFASPRANVLPIPTIFYGWNRAKENSNGPLPGEVGRPPKSAHTSGLGFSTAPGAAYDGDPLDFIGAGSVTWTPYVPTPPALLPPCDAPSGPIVAGVGGLALGGPGVMWARHYLARAGLTAAAAIVASSLADGAAEMAASASVEASSLELAEAVMAAAPSVDVTANLTDAEAAIAAAASVDVTANSTDAEAAITASVAISASSLADGAADVSAPADVEVTSSFGASAAALQTDAEVVASSLVHGEGDLSAEAEIVASSLIDREGDLSAEAEAVASSLIDREGDLSAEAEVVASSEHDATAHVAASASERASSEVAPEAAIGARAAVVASSLRAAAGSIGAHASVVASSLASGSAHVTGTATVPSSLCRLGFNGTTQYVSMGNPAALQITSKISISAWINLTGTLHANNNTCVAKFGSASSISGNSWSLFMFGSTGHVYFAVASGSSAFGQADGGLLSANTLYHVVGTYDGSTAKIYVNGSLVNSVAYSGALNNISAGVTIGSDLTGAGGAAATFFPGNIDAVRIYNTALTAAQVSEIYNSGSGLSTAGGASANLAGWWKLDEGHGTTANDSTSNHNNGTLNNSPSWQPAAILG